jgi:hypothetical protein
MNINKTKINFNINYFKKIYLFFFKKKKKNKIIKINNLIFNHIILSYKNY